MPSLWDKKSRTKQGEELSSQADGGREEVTGVSGAPRLQVAPAPVAECEFSTLQR